MFVVAEALTNVAKHAPTAARITVCAGEHDGDLVVQVVDDGPGGADVEAGSGLRGLEDRVAAADGHLVLVSPAGGGTTVRARLPLAPAA
ncbi:sensor histidine kinase [Paraconexibacter antarcticus]|uniref:sensor histidine kinase n=1 Tax=Paraconexibacter antarcticus TaxID=2949664 RepID=UPI0034603010